MQPEPAEESQTLQRLQHLLSQLVAEHAAEVRSLKRELEQLQNAPSAPSASSAALGDEKRRDEDELGSLRSVAYAPVPDVRPSVTEVVPPGVPAQDLPGFGDDLVAVRASIYSLQGLPDSLFQGNLLAEGAQCRMSLTWDGVKHCTALATLEQDAIPGQVSTDTWKAVWEESPGEVLLSLPAPAPENMKIEMQIAGCEDLITTGLVTLNAQRQKWALSGGGTLDAELYVDQGEALPDRLKPRATVCRERICQRLESLFGVQDPSSKVVMPGDVFRAVKACRNKKSRQITSTIGAEDMEEVVRELKRIHQKIFERCKSRPTLQRQPVLSWAHFQDCIMMEELPKHAAGNVALNIFVVQQALLGDDAPTSGASSAYLMAYEKMRKPPSTSKRWVDVVTALSTGAILLSFLFLGISLDNDPDWLGWLAFDALFAAIFVMEVGVKTYVLSAREYFCGRDRMWNLLDVLLSAVAVGETIVSVIFLTSGNELKATLMLRGLRLARMARFVKLMRMPLLEELTNIVSGFVISVRSLFWVMLTLTMVVYVMALGFRATVQAVSQNALETCGYGDFLPMNDRKFQGDDPPCKLHYMYGEEYCGSVLGCMFSIFRCMIGECTSSGGRSLSMIFSDGFGTRFDMFYAVSMVVVLFGLFNIITAIFLEATLNGLKENETTQRYAQAYESDFMTEQLAKLVMVLSAQIAKIRSSRTSSMTTVFGDSLLTNFRPDSPRPDETDVHLRADETYLSEEEFNQLIRLPDVRQLLKDLDVNVEPRPGTFDAFNTEEDGTVSISELVSGLMRLRGDLHKIDLVIAQMGLDSMQKQMTELRASQALIQQTLGVGVKSRSKTSPNLPNAVSRLETSPM